MGLNPLKSPQMGFNQISKKTTLTPEQEELSDLERGSLEGNNEEVSVNENFPSVLNISFLNMFALAISITDIEAFLLSLMP